MRRRTFVRQGGIRRQLNRPCFRRLPHRDSRCRTRRKALRHKHEQNRWCGERLKGANSS